MDVDGDAIAFLGAFWNALKEIAAARNIRVSKLVSTIKIDPRSNLYRPPQQSFVCDPPVHSRLLPTVSPMAPNPKHPPGPPMTLDNMRKDRTAQ
jgi:hypothetical protein